MKKRLTIILSLCIFCCIPSEIKPLPPGISIPVTLAATYAIRLLLELHNGNCEITLNTIANLSSNDCQFVMHLASEMIRFYNNYSEVAICAGGTEGIRDYFMFMHNCKDLIINTLNISIRNTLTHLR